MIASALVLVLGAATSAPASSPVALVALVEGDVGARAASAPRRAVALLDWVEPGTTIDVGSGGRVVLVFATGKRHAIEAGGRATVTASGLDGVSGPVKDLPAVPTLPRPRPLAIDDPPGSRAAAVRIRGDRVRGLYPGMGASVLADAAVLRFRAVAGAPAYKVRVEDTAGHQVFEVETSAVSVPVPPGTLRPGTTYLWMVRTVGTVGSPSRGEAEFSTVASEDAANRAALRDALAGDAAAAAVLAEVDRSLGLWDEALAGLRAAAAVRPGNAGLQAALARTEKAFAAQTGAE